MTEPAPVDLEADELHDPGPVPADEVDEADDGEAGALAAYESANYAAAYAEQHPIAEVAE
jgi:hypothetical protein